LTSALQTQLFSLALVLIIVVRFLYRELRARVVRLSTMWVRPAFVAAITAYLTWLAIAIVGDPPTEIFGSAAIGIVAGIVVGWLVVASTTIEPGPTPGRVRLHGSWVTVAIWLVALLIRLGIRLATGGYGIGAGSGPAAVAGSIVTGVGTVAMVFSAFGTFAILIIMRARGIAPGAADGA